MNTKNLIPFKKGDDARRNMNGRPKKLPDLDTIIFEVLSQKDKQDRPLVKAIIEKLTEMALRGDLRAAEVLLERYYGKVKNTIEMQSNEPREIIIRRESGESYPPIINRGNNITISGNVE